MSSTIPSPIGPATADKRGTQSAAHFSKLEALPANATLEERLLAIEAAEHAPVTLGAVGATPNDNGAELAGQVLTLQPADATHPGVLTTGAQTIGGVKTLTGSILAGVTTITEALTALVRAAGVSLVLRSSLGAGAPDKCVVVGSSDTDSNNNAAAKQLVVATGIGGTQVDQFSVAKGGKIRGSSATALLDLNDSVGAQISYGANATVRCGGSGTVELIGGTAALQTVHNRFYTNAAAGVNLYSTAAVGASDAGANIGTTQAAPNSAMALGRFMIGMGGGATVTGTAVAKVTAGGEFESLITGAGIVLKSPDGTRYRLTVANGGTLSIAAA